MGTQAEEGQYRGLVRYPPGSNGGVHRGPDKFPRRNAIRAVFLHAMAQDQERVHIDPSTGEPEVDAEGKPVKRKMKFAMVRDIVTAYQLIARHAAAGKDLDQFLRMMHDAHKMGPERFPDRADAGSLSPRTANTPGALRGLSIPTPSRRGSILNGPCGSANGSLAPADFLP